MNSWEQKSFVKRTDPNDPSYIKPRADGEFNLILKEKNRIKKKRKKNVTNSTQQNEHCAQLSQDTNIPKINLKLKMEETNNLVNPFDIKFEMEEQIFQLKLK